MIKLFYAEVSDECDTFNYLIKNCRTVRGAEKKLKKHLGEQFGAAWVRKSYIYVREVYLTNDITYL